MKYINSLLEKKCSSELIELYRKNKNPAKEITESYAAYHNMKPFINAKDPNVANIFIGDGSLCMTGALFVFMTKNWSICIDPLINAKNLDSWINHSHVNHFIYFKDIYQNFKYDLKKELDVKGYNIICVHSHVNLVDVIEKFPNWNYLYTNPCCKRDTQTLSLSFQKENNISTVLYGRDENILSEKNEVIIYKNGRT